MLIKLMIGLAGEGVATMTEQTRKSGFDLDEILTYFPVWSCPVRSGLSGLSLDRSPDNQLLSGAAVRTLLPPLFLV